MVDKSNEPKNLPGKWCSLLSRILQKTDADVIQVMSISAVSDTSEDGLEHGYSEDLGDGCKAKKKGKKKKLKSGMTLKAKDAGIKVKIK